MLVSGFLRQMVHSPSRLRPFWSNYNPLQNLTVVDLRLQNHLWLHLIRPRSDGDAFCGTWLYVRLSLSRWTFSHRRSRKLISCDVTHDVTQCKLWGIGSPWERTLDRLERVMVLVGLVLLQDQFQSRDLQADIWDYGPILHKNKKNKNKKTPTLTMVELLCQIPRKYRGFFWSLKLFGLSNSLALSECDYGEDVWAQSEGICSGYLLSGIQWI